MSCKPRAAQNLFELLPTIEVGPSQLVERDALLAFLQQVHDAHEPALLFAALRQAKPATSRQRIRSLIRSDFVPTPLASPPAAVSLAQGRMAVSFESIEELAESLMQIALILTQEANQFASLYEPLEPPHPLDQEEKDDVFRMFAELESIERLKEK